VNLGRHENLWRLSAGERLRYGSAILAIWLTTVFLFGVPLVSKAVIDGALPRAASEPVSRDSDLFGLDALAARLAAAHGLGTVLWGAALLIVLLTAVAGAFQYLRGRWASMASEGIVRSVRDALYGHLERLPSAYHDQADTGDVVQRCSSDVETVRVFLAAQVVEIGRALLLLLTAIPIMWSLDARMTLVSLSVFPLIVCFALAFFRRVKKLFLSMDEAEAAMTTVLQENLTGIRVVRAFARQDFESRKFAARNAAFRDRTHRLIRLLGVYWSSSDFLCFTQQGATLIVGGWWLSRDALSAGTLFAFVTYVAMVIWPVRQMGRVLADTGKATVSLGRIEEILAVPLEPAGGRVPERALTGEIVFEGLSFGFGAKGEVLSDVSFRVRPGETLALLGPPGSGKSTLVHLLLRLYDYERGSIRLDGHELSGLERGFVRAQIGAVLQEPFLYSKTIGANIGIGRSGAAEEEIAHAAATASVDESIREFEHGFDTLVGERGVTLSGGQRQRVSLARALLKEPPILVLDDSLSAVDTRTEAQILSALRERHGRRTTLLITHRLSSATHADRLLLLERGRVVQSGRHQELLAADGPYRRLWRIQGALEHEIERGLRADGAEGVRS